METQNKIILGMLYGIAIVELSRVFFNPTPDRQVLTLTGVILLIICTVSLWNHPRRAVMLTLPPLLVIAIFSIARMVV